MKTFIALAASLATIAGIGFAGYEIGANNSIARNGAIIVLKDSISDLPQNKRSFALQLIDVIENLQEVPDTSGSGRPEVSKLASQFTTLISETSFLSYDVNQPTFALRLKKTVLLCNGDFSVGYPLDNSRGSQRILVNGEIEAGTPGAQFIFTANGTQLQLRYMEYREEEKAVIFTHECQSI